MPKILGVNVDVSSYRSVVQNSLAWAASGESRALFFANVHVIMEAFDNVTFRERLNRADMVNPDGMPLVWALRALGQKDASRVYGPDSTVAMLTAAEKAKIPVGFYGGNPSVLTTLVGRLREQYPGLKIAYQVSPPFRVLSDEEDAVVVRDIAASGAKILFVGLGCPKQENWIIDHVGRVPAVMFGVGAAFDFLAGTKSQAPRWMMKSGMEWAFRFASEPRRLAHRYLKHNPRFIVFFLQQLASGRLS